jgi:predicted nucleotidyltransferase
MVALTRIVDFVSRVAQEFRPQRIILFGSHAYGTPTEDSDADLLVVMPHSGRTWEMAAEIRGRVRPGFPLDLIIRSPEELNQRLAMGDPFLEEIVTRGKVLYEAHNG